MIFHQKPEKKPFYKLENCLFFFPPLFQTIMDKSLGTLLRFWGVFQFTQVQPLPSPHKQCWTRVSRIFFRVSTLYKVGGGRTARKFRKGGTVLRRNRQMTEKYEYRSTVPRTFVQDCSIRYYGASRPKRWIRTPWECCYRYFYFTDTSVLMFCLYLFVSFCC